MISRLTIFRGFRTILGATVYKFIPFKLQVIYEKEVFGMSQKLISTFFTSPKGVKRKHDCVTEDTDFIDEQIENGVDWRPKIIHLAKERSALSPNIGLTWFKVLEKEFLKDYFKELSNFLEKEREAYTVYPPEKDVYSWTIAMKMQDVKVVILGQDPYHGPNQAHGLAFSVRKGIPSPPSLKNMFKELSSDVPNFKTPSHGYLYGWATQGVLLLNTCLTVRSGKANSHRNKGWEKLTDSVIKSISGDLTNVVFLLWGGNAKQKKVLIDEEKHLVLTAVHPSPLSAHNGFFGCRHFSKANDYLSSHKKKTIDWTYLP